MFQAGYAYIDCPNCHGKLQALTEHDYGLDTDIDRLTVIAEAHWQQCTQQAPWINDPNAFYG
jgi:hypothetical protein